MPDIDNLQNADGQKEKKVTTIKSKINETSKNKIKALKEDPNKEDEVINEIEKSNAKDAEVDNNKNKHKIEAKDYSEMSLESLVIELENLTKKEKAQDIKTHIEAIKKEFNSKFNTLLDEKKAEIKRMLELQPDAPPETMVKPH